jgi:hypothetical protein
MELAPCQTLALRDHAVWSVASLAHSVVLCYSVLLEKCNISTVVAVKLVLSATA